jgi:rfaE bifunctional protein nucleotidyltransferase chain/domain
LGQVVSQRELLSRRGEWKRTGQAVVCAYGAFDLLHPGHIRLLEEARELGDLLVVAVQSDAIVRSATATAASPGHPATSGDVDRPITPAEERAEILAAVNAVDFAAVADDPLPAFLRQFQPDVFVCGDEPSGRMSPDASGPFDRAVAAMGCKVVRVPIEPGYSTSLLIERITGRRA